MKEVTIFLASSINEFVDERRDLVEFIRRLDDAFAPSGVRFRPIVCEEASNALSAVRKQDEYNGLVAGSDYVYVIVGRSLGTYTHEEFGAALEGFRGSGKPLIYTYFRYAPDSADVDGSVAEFAKELDQSLGHYWSRFDRTDEIKLNIALEAIRGTSVEGAIRLEGGRAVLGGVEVARLSEVPAFGANDSLQDLYARLEEAGKRLAIVKMQFVETGDDSLIDEMHAEKALQDDLAGKIRAAEEDTLRLLSLMAEKGHLGTELKPREAQAIGLARKGCYEEANNLLRDPVWENELHQADAVGDWVLSEARGYISAKRLLVANLMAMGVTEQSEREILDVFARAGEVARRWHVSLDVVSDHAWFLMRQKRYAESYQIADGFWKRYQYDPDVADVLLGNVCMLLDILAFYHHDYPASLAWCDRAAERFGRVKDGGAEITVKLAHVHSNRARTIWDSPEGDTSEGRKSLEMAFCLLETVPEDERGEDWRFVRASSRSRMGALALKDGDAGESERWRLAALEDARLLTLSGKDKYLNLEARIHNNLGKVYRKTGAERYSEAEHHYREALRIRKEGAKRNPSLFNPGIANVQVNLGALLRIQGRLDESIEVLREALETREYLAKVNPDAWGKSLCITLRELGTTLEQVARHEEALECCERSVEAARSLCARSPESYSETLEKSLEALNKLRGME